MKRTTFTAFSWEVETQFEDGPTPEENGPVIARTLVVHPMLLLPVPDPNGNMTTIPLEELRFPFGSTPTGLPMWERIALLMRGEDLPPEVQVAPAAMLGHLGKNARPR